MTISKDILEQLLKENSFSEIIEALKTTKEDMEVQMSDLTIVTGLWNIGRPERTFKQYIENFKKFLDIPVNMFLYVPKDLEPLVWERRSKKNTYVRIFELDDIKNNFYAPFWERTQSIRTNPAWLNQTGNDGWLKKSPQAVVKWYNPIVQSKMFMLHDAKVLDVFKTNYFVWLDAGITNTVYEKYFTENRSLDKIIPHLKNFLFLSYPYKATDEIHGFNFKAMNGYARRKVNYVCRGGLFGGHKDFITQANSLYYSILDETLNSGYMGTEESIFTIMANLQPAVYRRYALDENGLIVKFVQALIDNKVELEDVSTGSPYMPKGTYSEERDKTSLYVLGFNFPEQFRALLTSFEKHPEWLNNPRKILINNSQETGIIEQYNSLCEKYGFEHIVTGENLGINRGRLLAAKHFQESNSDYYYFRIV